MASVKSKSKFCESCNACVINNDGVIIGNALHLVREKSHIYVCNECCNSGKQIIFEEFGFQKFKNRILPEVDEIPDNIDLSGAYR